MISVLTPTYNHGRFLNDAIVSVDRQSGTFEHVVVDGQSTDDTQGVLASWAPKVRSISEPDQGQSDALNKALNLARGDIVGWLNADEFYMPGVFEVVQTEFANDPDLAVLVGDSILVDEHGDALRLYASQPLSPSALKWYDCYILTSGLFIRRSALSSFHFDSDLKVCMDWDLLLFLLMRGMKFKATDQTFAAFRVHPEQASARLASRRSAEYGRIAARYGISSSGQPFKRTVGRSDRVLRKAATGAYMRELRFLRARRGSNVRWFDDADGRHQ